MKDRWTTHLATLLILCSFIGSHAACENVGSSGLRFEITIPSSVRDEPVTGRLFVAISPDEGTEPRIATYNSARRRDGRVPFFAVDVHQLAAGDIAVVDGSSDGYPLGSLDALPAGDYSIQAVLNVYTEFRRADGHILWAHMDQWEGQRWGFSPGNLVSEPERVHLDPRRGAAVKLQLTEQLPPIEIPKDTAWVKRIRFQSDLLTEFWGHPIFLGATVLLPRGYEDNPNRQYPVVYLQGHFSLDPPFGFDSQPPQPGQPDLFQDMRERSGTKRETGYEFHQSWVGEDFPRVIAVTFQHPTPFFDDSYAVNSVNNGPYGDAILKELIPRVEQEFRIIAEPYARVLTGGSTGGWESLALQVYHPEFFGGTWTFYPDPVDFRKYQLINIYEDDSAFIVPGSVAGAPERMFQRTPDGQPLGTVRQMSQLEAAQGSRGRSAGQLDAWNAAYGPVGEDGYPRRLWELKTGTINHEVADYMRDNGYDLRNYIETHWSDIGSHLVGKIHLFNPEMDDFYLPYAVYLLEDFLESTTDPYYAGEVIHGRPMKGHGWSPTTDADLIRTMAEHIVKNAPPGADTRWLNR